VYKVPYFPPPLRISSVKEWGREGIVKNKQYKEEKGRGKNRDLYVRLMSFVYIFLNPVI